MKPVKVTTVEQARALPEVSHPFLDERTRILHEDDPGVGRRGDMVREYVTRPYCPQPMDGDQILLFVDSDGRRMQIVYTPDGPAKTPFRL